MEKHSANRSGLMSEKLYNRTRIRLIAILLVFIIYLSLPGIEVMQAKASVPLRELANPYDVVAAVNQLRQARGLAPYQINDALMNAAQAHSNYQASIGTVTHTGVGGSSAKSRAIAAGYGGGTTVFVSENIYGGNNASPQQAVQWWQGDSLHLNTMISASYVDVGAGVATDGNITYYTLDVGYLAGSSGGESTIPQVNTTASGTGIAVSPVQISTPNPDGSIVHIVQPGETFWSIAVAYQISVPDLLALNGRINNNTIFVGDKILIKSADIEPTIVISETPTAINTPRPTRTYRPTSTELAMGSPELAESVVTAPTSNSFTVLKEPLFILIASLIVGGLSLFLVGSLLKRARE